MTKPTSTLAPAPTYTPSGTSTPTKDPTSNLVPTHTPTPTPMPTRLPTPTLVLTPTLTPLPTKIAIATPTPTPTTMGTATQVLRLFQKPFDGDFRLTNFFDHNSPILFEDQNSFQLTWWNERAQGVDGHNGYDWAMPEGTPLLAVADGEVLSAGSDESFFCPPMGKFVSGQLFVEVVHTAPNGERFNSVYVHVSRVDVQRGQLVRSGQQIALSGNTGCSTEPHLHFQVWRLTNTKTTQPTIIDPYGWEGTEPDPWFQHTEGAQSIWLWKEGQVPAIFREKRIAPNTAPRDNASVAITAIRWMGYRDDQNPNNEYVQLELDPRFASSGVSDLTGFRLQNNRGESFQFPDGFAIQQNRPVRIFTGSGKNTATELYWKLSHGVWDNRGDCAHLMLINGRLMDPLLMYRLRYGPTC